MRWLCLHFPQLPLEALGGDTLRGDWVLGQHGSHRWALTGAGAVRPGMPLALARLKAPEARILPRQRDREQAALRDRAQIADAIGSPVVADLLGPDEPYALPQPCVWVEVSASEALFGGLEALCTRLMQTLIDNGLCARLGIAPSRSAAALLAQQGDARPCLLRQDLPARLAALPIAALPWPRRWRETLQALGLQRIGEVEALPRAGLQRRLGAELLQALDQLHGRAAEPYTAIVPPARFDQHLELLEEIAEVEALLFPLRRLLGQLAAWLRLRGQRLQRYRLDCTLAWDQSPPCIVELLQPVQHLDALFIPLREQLLARPPPAPVRALRLVAEVCVEPQADQLDALAPRRQSQDWTACLDRLRARLGPQALWTPVCREDHRPAAAQDRGPPGIEGAAAPAAPRPLWWQHPPQALPQPPALQDIERIEGGWWSDTPLAADYGWTDIGGRRAWVRRETSGDPLGDRAWVEGWWG